MPKATKRLTILIVSLLAIAAPACAAQKDAQGARMEAAFKTWVGRWNVENASLAAMRGSELIGQAQKGAYRTGGAVPVASLSKAITGVCIVKLVEAGRLRYADRIGVTLADYFKTNPPKSAAAKQITVAQLLTQSSGIAYDPTQGSAVFGSFDLTKTNMPEQLALALARPLGAKNYFYNNINYDVLGMIVEAVTRQPYETYCGKTVLRPAGADATLNPPLRTMNAYGGWKISALHYARFLDNLRPASKLFKTNPATWPKSNLGGGASYSIGMLVRKEAGSYNFWHEGAFSITTPQMSVNVGAYFAQWRQDTRFVATYSPQPASGAVHDLDRVMYEAAFAGPASALAEAGPTPVE